MSIMELIHDIQSYHHFMYEHLFDHIDIEKSFKHNIPKGELDSSSIRTYYQGYDEKIARSKLSTSIARNWAYGTYWFS